MTTAINESALLSIRKIRGILALKKEMEPQVFASLQKFGNRNQLLDLMFELPYLKIDLLVKKGIAHRETASGYLKKLEQDGLLTPYKTGKGKCFVNHRLMDLLVRRA